MSPPPSPAPAPAPSARPAPPARAFSPLVVASVVFALGIAADRFVLPLFTSAWAILGVGAGIAALKSRERGRYGWLFLALALACAGAARHHEIYWERPADDLARSLGDQPRPGWVRGVLTTVPEHRIGSGDWGDEDGYTHAELDLTAVRDGLAWRPASGRAVLTIAGDRSDLRAGDPVRAAGLLGRVRGPSNPGEIDFRPAMRARGIGVRLSVDDPAAIGPDPDGRPWAVPRLLGRVRAWCERSLLGRLDPRSAPLASALLLGRRGAVSHSLIDAFADTGTTHLLAISGLHFQALAVALYLVGKALGWPVRARVLVVVVALVTYATLVGWMPSVTRATVMALTMALGRAAGREIGPGSLLGLAALATLAFQPCDLFHPGWQLSFAAVAALFWGVEPALSLLRRARGRDSEGLIALDELEWRFAPAWKKSGRKALRWIATMALASVVVSLVTAPLTLWWFNIVSPVGVALNLVLIPITSAALLMSGITLLLSWAGPLATPAAWACGWLLDLTTTIVFWGDSLRGGRLHLPSPPTGWVLAAYLSMTALVALHARRWRRPAWVVAAAVAAVGYPLISSPHRPAAPEADILAVGHGLAVVLQTPDGRAFLYDCGRSRDPEVGRRVIAPALWKRGIRSLEAVFISHGDLDHLNGLPDLLDRFRIRALYGPPALLASDNPATRAILDRARLRGVPLLPLRAGDSLDLAPDLVADAIHPPADWSPDSPENDGSLVLTLSGPGSARLLLTGDLDGQGLGEVVSRPPPDPFDAVLSPHHGGRTANPESFHEWAGSRLVLVSQQEPRPGATDPLADLAAPVLRTWRDGALRLAWSADGLLARTFIEPPRPEAAPTRTTLRPPFPDDRPSVLGLALATLLGLGLGLALLVALIAIEWGAWALVSPRRGLGGTAGAPWRSIEARSIDGLLLRAWSRPAAAPGRGLLVLVHGLGETGPALLPRADLAAALGWDVLMPDARAFGRSEGTRASFGAREAADLASWIDALEPAGPVVLWGRSMGAATALKTATADPRVSGLILEAPYDDLALSVSRRLARFPIPGFRLLAPLLLRRANRLAGATITRPRPVDLAPLLSRCPVLLLAGGLDQIVPPGAADRLAAAFPPGALVDLVEAPDAGHADVFEQGGAAVAKAVEVFLSSRN